MTTIMIPDEILTTAKEAMRAFGQFQPMLFVDGTKRRIYMPLPFGETSDERVANHDAGRNSACQAAMT